MRMRTRVALVGLLLTATGCTITLPAGVGVTGAVGVTGTGKPTGNPGANGDPSSSGAPCADRFVKYDKNKDKALSLDEYLARGGENADKRLKADEAQRFLLLDENGDRKLSVAEFAADCGGGPKPVPTTRPRQTPPPPPPGSGCEGAFAKFDRDQDGTWTLEEFLGWDASRPRPKSRCAGGVPGGAGGVVPMGGGTIVAAGGMTMGPTRGLAQVLSNGGVEPIGDNGGQVVSNDGGGLIANDGGGLIANNAGGLIDDGPAYIDPANAGGLIANNGGPMPFPCPPDDPKFRFGQFDHDGDGLISAREFCEGPVKPPMPMPRPSWGPEPYPLPGPFPTPGYTPGPTSCEDGFFRTDSDGDGLISPEEFKVNFRTPDMVYSNNGTRAEWVQPAMIDPYAVFKSQDRDGDGFLSLEESCGIEPPMPVETPPPADWCGFYKIDVDHNGEATWEEFVNWSVRNEFPAPTKDVVYTRFASHDFDQNMVITQDEYCNYAQPEPYPYPSVQPTPWASTMPPPPPTPMPTSDSSNACFDTYLKASGGSERPITFEAYAQARMDQVRWFQAPTDEEVARMKASYASEARAYDQDGDGLLSYAEAKALCASQAN